MIRITPVNQDDTLTTLRIEGRIVEGAVPVVESETRRWLLAGCRVVLDLAGVNFIGTAGVAFLRRMMTENVEIINVSSLVQSLLL